MSSIALDPGIGGQCIGSAALEVADLVVSTTPAAVSRAIRWVTGSAVSHAMLYVGRGNVIEAISQGVVLRPLSTALNGAALAVAYRRRAMTPATAQRVVGHARAFVGRRYNYAGAVVAGKVSVGQRICLRRDATVRGICLVSIRAGMLAVQQRRGRRTDRFFCSELVLESFRLAGVPIATVSSSFATPDGIPLAFSNGILSYVGHLRS